MSEQKPKETPIEKQEETHVHTDAVPLDLYEQVRKENVTLKRQVQAYKMREKLPRNAPKPEAEPKAEAPPQTGSTEVSASPHYVGPWQQYCPTCGDKNPDFKDETICNPDKGGCGMHLGAATEVEKLKACPNCGGTHASRLRK